LLFLSKFYMTKYQQIEKLNEEEFRRLTGIKKVTFNRMVEIVTEAEKVKKASGGKPNKVSIEGRLLMALEYWREYRTYFHIAQGYDISESACYRNIKWVEDTLVKHKDFALPGRKALLKNPAKYEVIMVDATETPIERPKKTEALLLG